jgi:hypothetical protein
MHACCHGWHGRPIRRTGERLTPEDLISYHRVNKIFRLPCCLCAYFDFSTDYTESAIYVATDGDLAGEYVAKCATNHCGYQGEMSLTQSNLKRRSDRLNVY